MQVSAIRYSGSRLRCCLRTMFPMLPLSMRRPREAGSCSGNDPRLCSVPSLSCAFSQGAVLRTAAGTRSACHAALHCKASA